MQTRRKLIIFDGDDTLWKTQELYELTKKQFARILLSSGFMVSENYILKLIDNIDLNRVNVLKLSRSRFLESLLITYAILCGKEGKTWDIEVERKVRNLEERIFHKPRLYEDALETLQALSNNHDLVLFTSGDKDVQLKKIRLLGNKFSQFFKEIRIVDIKDEEGYAKLIESLHVEPKDAYMIGNSLRSDIIPAVEIGIKAIWIPRGNWKYDHAVTLDKNYVVVNSLKEAGYYILEQENVLHSNNVGIELKKLKYLLSKLWSKETCFPELYEKWSNRLSSLGQCAVTALIVQDFFGGEILYCKHLQHFWNLLPDGSEVDLTRSQFKESEKICVDGIVTRDYILDSIEAKKANTKERYIYLKNKLLELLKEEKNARR
jgi:putative hydrolase of the HAD superfamily